MTTENPPPRASPGYTVDAAHDCLPQLVEALGRWGELFLRMADEERVPAAEQVLGGLVDWMGNGLLDGWLHLPIARFEAISDLAEDLLQACQAYLARLRQATPSCSAADRTSHRAAIRTIMARTQALAVPDPQPPTPDPKG